MMRDNYLRERQHLWAVYRLGQFKKGDRGPHRPLPKNIILRKLLRTISALLVMITITAGCYVGHVSGVFMSLKHDAAEVSRNIIISSGLTVGKIKVSGGQNIQNLTLERSLHDLKGRFVFDVDLKLLRNRIEALGWVRSASVRRQFPGTIRVNIVERRPFAIWQHDGRENLVDRDGRVITIENLARFEKLPIIVGVEAPDHVADLLPILARHPHLFGKISAMTLVSSRRWDLSLDNGIRVKLPEEDVAAAWDYLDLLAREHSLLSRDVAAIDLRITGRLVVTTDSDIELRPQSNGQDT